MTDSRIKELKRHFNDFEFQVPLTNQSKKELFQWIVDNVIKAKEEEKECEHPYASIIGDSTGSEKCLKCNTILI